MFFFELDSCIKFSQASPWNEFIAIEVNQTLICQMTNDFKNHFERALPSALKVTFHLQGKEAKNIHRTRKAETDTLNACDIVNQNSIEAMNHVGQRKESGERLC